ncbi:hypothetical protein FJT64_003042 [Amphibalanus amphitrite]|uniref:Uncharacterized protein n=1 Tax=Amphibalanus amphitrite TaxID=1232801 RepID=A0A6A4W620_AMPAM|nr:hypothetical protein FJT64_003042 [Amphibalanus amphitrite]
MEVHLLVPGTVDADIGELEREIDEIAADVASMARVSAPADSEGDRFSSAHSVTTWTSRSAPDVSSLLDAPSLLPAHSSAQRVRQQLVNKWRDETAASGSSSRSHSLRPTRSQVATAATGRRPPPRHRRSRQTLEPRRQISFRSML